MSRAVCLLGELIISKDNFNTNCLVNNLFTTYLFIRMVFDGLNRIGWCEGILSWMYFMYDYLIV